MPRLEAGPMGSGASEGASEGLTGRGGFTRLGPMLVNNRQVAAVLVVVVVGDAVGACRR